MSQRASGYDRKANDLYETPAWVTQALVPHLQKINLIWEPAAGTNAMADVLTEANYKVITSDLSHGTDFLKVERLSNGASAIITNPPFNLATQFIERALELMKPGGLVAMLTRVDFDSAKTRRHLFADHPAFCKKIVLLRRIVWFEPATASPSFNHCWMIWDWRHQGPPTIAYGP